MENANLVWKSGAETSKCTLGTAAALLADPASLLSSLVGETDRETQASQGRYSHFIFLSPPPPCLFCMENQ